MGYIYKITNNINQKLYIGYTTKSLAERMRKHRSDTPKGDTVLGRAIRKYGWDNFSYEIVEKSNDAEYLLKLEQDYIKSFNSMLPNGYNMTPGGEKLYGENNPFFGKHHSQETRKYLSELAQQRTGERNHFYGKTHSDETKKKISKTKSKPVAAYNENGALVMSFEGGNEAQEWCWSEGLSVGKTPKTDIFKRCKDGKKAFGYYWKYIEKGVETRERSRRVENKLPLEVQD